MVRSSWRRRVSGPRACPLGYAWIIWVHLVDMAVNQFLWNVHHLPWQQICLVNKNRQTENHIHKHKHMHTDINIHTTKLISPEHPRSIIEIILGRATIYCILSSCDDNFQWRIRRGRTTWWTVNHFMNIIHCSQLSNGFSTIFKSIIRFQMKPDPDAQTEGLKDLIERLIGCIVLSHSFSIIGLARPV